jgi:predicted dehydrogenase
MRAMLQLGIIGCGRVTTMFHLRAIAELDNIILVGLSDIDESRLNEISGKTGVERTYVNYKDLLADSNVDAVAVNTPPEFHGEMVMDALNHGKHVLCEKPLARDLETLNLIKQFSFDSNLVVLPAHNYVFSPCLEIAQRLSSELGKLKSVKVCFQNNLQFYRSRTNFRITSNEGIVEDLLPHVLSVVIPIAGYPKDVLEHHWWCRSYNVCDNLKVSLVTFDDVNLNFKFSWTSLVPRFYVKVEGEKGFLEMDLFWNPYAVKLKTCEKSMYYRTGGFGWYLDLLRLKHPSFRSQYLHFEKTIRGVERPLISVENEIAINKTISKISKFFYELPVVYSE